MSKSSYPLYNGGNFLNLNSINETVDSSLLSAIIGQIFGETTEGKNFDKFSVKSAHYFNLLTSVNYASRDRANAIVSSEIGLYDHSKRIFVQRLWRNISGGELIAVRATENRSSDRSIKIRDHSLLFSRDLHGRNTLFEHVWNDIPDSNTPLKSKSDSLLNTAANKKPLNIRVLTFNIWHNNPASWVYPDSQ